MGYDVLLLRFPSRLPTIFLRLWKNQNSKMISKHNVFTIVLYSAVNVFLQFFVVEYFCWVFRWRSCFLLIDFQDSYVISRGIILRSVQVNSSAILIQTRVVDNNFCKPYECHCESFIVRIIFSYLFFASADNSKGSLKIHPFPLLFNLHKTWNPY